MSSLYLLRILRSHRWTSTTAIPIKVVKIRVQGFFACHLRSIESIPCLCLLCSSMRVRTIYNMCAIAGRENSFTSTLLYSFSNFKLYYWVLSFLRLRIHHRCQRHRLLRGRMQACPHRCSYGNVTGRLNNPVLLREQIHLYLVQTTRLSFILPTTP